MEHVQTLSLLIQALQRCEQRQLSVAVHVIAVFAGPGVRHQIQVVRFQNIQCEGVRVLRASGERRHQLDHSW